MTKTVSTTLGEVIVVEMEPIEDSGYRWSVKWIPAELQFLEQQVMNADDKMKKQRFLFLTVAAPIDGTTKLCFVLQSDEKLDDIKETEEVTVTWNTDLKFVSYNPNIQNQVSQDTAMKYGFPCVAQTAKPYGLYYGGDMAQAPAGIEMQPFIRKHHNLYAGQMDANNVSSLQAYGYPCVAQTAMPYGMVADNTAMMYNYPASPINPVSPINPNPVMKYGYPCAAQTAVPYGYSMPVDPVMKYGYPCAAQASMPYGYSFPNYDGQ